MIPGPVIRTIQPADIDAVVALWEEAGLAAYEQSGEAADEITAKLEEGITENCEDTVRAFINFTKGHFNREEQFLIKLGYPDVSKHRKHHHELYEKMDHIMEFARSASANELARKSLKKELVFFLMDDVITTDLDFKSFIGGEKT